MDTRQLFASLLKNLRKQKKYSKRQLSEESGVSISYISGLENAKYVPTIDVIFKLSDALGYPPDQMVKWLDLKRSDKNSF